jgi:hypothetical protein
MQKELAIILCCVACIFVAVPIWASYSALVLFTVGPLVFCLFVGLLAYSILHAKRLKDKQQRKTAQYFLLSLTALIAISVISVHFIIMVFFAPTL